MSAFGLLNIDKPSGVTSHDVVDVVRKGTGVSKVGHAGTLDPMATGVLVLCVGSATRLSEYIMGHTKTYLATVQLGQTTTTYDAEGSITSENATPISRDEFERALPSFKGYIKQVPPMYSAVKVGGEKLYDKARRGEDIERDARDVAIYRVQVEKYEYPEAVLLVRCSPGTYVRSLAHDIGQVLEVGAHLSGLRRLSSGENFTVDNAVTLDDFEQAIAHGIWQDYLLDVSLGLSQLPRIELNQHQENLIRNGQFVNLEISNQGPVQAWANNGDFIGILSRRGDDDEWKPDKVFNNNQD